MNKLFQFISWFPNWNGFHFIVTKPYQGIFTIYEWCFYLGFWEVRKWVRPEDVARRLTAYNSTK